MEINWNLDKLEILSNLIEYISRGNGPQGPAPILNSPKGSLQLSS